MAVDSKGKNVQHVVDRHFPCWFLVPVGSVMGTIGYLRESVLSFSAWARAFRSARKSPCAVGGASAVSLVMGLALTVDCFSFRGGPGQVSYIPRLGSKAARPLEGW
jgi:hypothetical protein